MISLYYIITLPQYLHDVFQIVYALKVNLAEAISSFPVVNGLENVVEMLRKGDICIPSPSRYELTKRSKE